MKYSSYHEFDNYSVKQKKIHWFQGIYVRYFLFRLFYNSFTNTFQTSGTKILVWRETNFSVLLDFLSTWQQATRDVFQYLYSVLYCSWLWGYCILLLGLQSYLFEVGSLWYRFEAVSSDAFLLSCKEFIASETCFSSKERNKKNVVAEVHRGLFRSTLDLYGLNIFKGNVVIKFDFKCDADLKVL